jgi:hypothetical protein
VKASNNAASDAMPDGTSATARAAMLGRLLAGRCWSVACSLTTHVSGDVCTWLSYGGLFGNGLYVKGVLRAWLACEERPASRRDC